MIANRARKYDGIPGFGMCATDRKSRPDHANPGRGDVQAICLPFLDNLRIACDNLYPASSAAAFIEATTRWSVSMGKPSSRINPAVR